MGRLVDNEYMQHPTRRLGRRPPSNKPALRLTRLLTGAMPAHSPTVDHFAEVDDWGLYTNDRFGVCGPTSVANLVKLITGSLDAAEWSPTLDDVYDLYRRSGNPDFDPDTGEGDNGVDMQTMLEALLSGGIGGQKPLAFAKVNHGDPDEMRAAIEIFGGVLYGVDLQEAQQSQTDAGLWDYVRGSQEWGGHAVLGGRYSDQAGTRDDRTGVVTWAELVDFTDDFDTHRVDEVWVVIWPENVGTRQFKEGIDRDALASAYESLTGRPFPGEPAPSPEPAPAPVPPEPSPVPPQPVPVDDPDEALAHYARQFVRHHISASTMRSALADWLAARDL